MYAIIRQRSWLVCHYGIAEDGRPGHPAGGIQLLLRYIRRADPAYVFVFLTALFIKEAID